MGSVETQRARFEQLYLRHAAEVAAYALRRAPAGTAEDVVAETFVVAWRRLDEVPDQPLPWLFGVARRTLANQRRSAARRDRLADRLRLELTSLPEAQVDGRLGEALGTLRPGDRELLMLIAWEGLTPTEAAAALGCSALACRLRLHRARKRLATALEAPDRQPSDFQAREAR